MPRRSLAAGIVLFAGALLSLLLTWSLMLGDSYKWKVFGLRLRAYDFTRPLPIGAALAAILLVYGWNRRGFRLLAIGLLAASGALALSAYARQAHPYIPAGDIALLESYTIDASRGQLLVGAYSRFGWHHPGPSYFYMLAPFYALADHRTLGMGAGALWINLVSLLALAWILLSRGRERLATVSMVFIALYLWRVREILASAWNPHVVIVPLMLLVVLGAAVAGGDLALLPALALLATLIVQTHVGLVPAAVAVSGCATVAAVVFTLRADRGARPPLYGSVNLALWVLAILWFLPLAEQFRSPHPNVAELWRFFTSPERHGQPFAPAFVAWGETLSAIVIPDVHVGWGGVFRSRSNWMPLVVSVLQVVALLAVAIRAGRSERRFACALAALLALTSVVGLWSATRIEDQLVDYAVFWLSGIGALNLATILSEMAGLVRLRSIPRGRLLSIAACAALYVVVAVTGVYQMHAAIVRSGGPGTHEMTAMRLSDQIESYFRDHPGIKPVIEVDPPLWGDVTGLVVNFQRKQIPFAVERGWLWMFTDLTAPAGDENAVLTIGRAGVRDELVKTGGATTIAEYRGVYAILARRPDPTGVPAR